MNSTAALNYFDKLEATYTDVPNTFSVQDNTVSIDAGAAAAPSTFTIANPNMGSDLDGKYTFHTVYFLARGDGNANLLKLELKTYNTGDANPIQTLNVDNVPTKKNFKTNVTATLDAASFTHNFTFDFADWEAEELEPVMKWDGTNPAVDAGYTFGGGDGGAGNPYLITCVADLAQLAVNVNAGTHYTGVYFKQTADLDLNNKEWTPIGTDNVHSFRGFYDGDMYKVSNLSINSNLLSVGLFGQFGNDETPFESKICNLHVDGSVTSTSTIDAWPDKASAGGICGYVRGRTKSYIANCSFSGTVTAALTAGGIVGWANGDCTILACKNIGTITGGKNSGGIVGVLNNTRIVAGYNEGIITGTRNDTYAGGISGHSEASNTYLCGCYNIGNVSNTSGATQTNVSPLSTIENGANCISSYYHNFSGSSSYGVPFASGDWPDGTNTGSIWYANENNDGTYGSFSESGSAVDCKFWKSAGSWNAGVPIFPKLWWEN